MIPDSFDEETRKKVLEQLERVRKSLGEPQASGPEIWHDTLTKYTELERRVAAIEEQMRLVANALSLI